MTIVFTLFKKYALIISPTYAGTLSALIIGERYDMKNNKKVIYISKRIGLKQVNALIALGYVVILK